MPVILAGWMKKARQGFHESGMGVGHPFYACGFALLLWQQLEAILPKRLPSPQDKSRSEASQIADYSGEIRLRTPRRLGIFLPALFIFPMHFF